MNYKKLEKFSKKYAPMIAEGKTEEEVLKAIQSDEEDFTDVEAKEIYAAALKLNAAPADKQAEEAKEPVAETKKQETPALDDSGLDGKHQRFEKWRVEATDVAGDDQKRERTFRIDFIKKLRPNKDAPNSYVVDLQTSIDRLNAQAHNTLVYYTKLGTESGSSIEVTIK